MVTRPNKIMKQKPKELKQCENCKWFTENRSDNCNFCLNKNEFKPKQLDVIGRPLYEKPKEHVNNELNTCKHLTSPKLNKPGELVWKKQIKPNDGVRYGFLTINGKYLNKKEFVDFIEKLLENQRKELLIKQGNRYDK